MNKLKPIQDKYGVAGMYVVLQLQILAANNKDNRVQLSKERTSKWAIEWQPTLKTEYPLPAEHLIRNVVKDLCAFGIAERIEVKLAHFLKFSTHLIADKKKVKISHSVKVVKDNSKAKPKTIEDVRLYMVERGIGERRSVKESEDFWDYWSERGWRRKTGEIKDWKATVRRWLKSEYREANSGGSFL